MLKDQFINQSAPSIRRRLQKLALGPSTKLKIPTSVFYNGDQEEKEKVREREQGEKITKD